MHILVVTQYFWPENFRLNDLCSALVARGHKITVLTGVPNYPQGSVFSQFKKKPLEYSEYKGVEIVRVPMFARGQDSSAKLFLNYLSYAVSASTVGLYKLRKHNFDVVFVCQLSPVTIALPAILYKKIYKKPIIMWVLDLWPESISSVGIVKSNLVLSLVGRLVSFIYSRCDLILGQSKAFYKGISLYCEDPQKIKYFPNWSEDIFSKELHSSVELISQYDGSYFKILFAGNIGEAQDFPSIVKSAEIIKEIGAKVKFFVVGDGRTLTWLKNEIHERSLEDFIYLLGCYPLEVMPNFYNSADALFVTLKESPVFSLTIPGKIQSYMASGKPILTMLTGEGSRVVEEAESGYIAESGDCQKFADNIVKMSSLSKEELGELGGMSRVYSDKFFSRDKLITQLDEWLTKVAVIDKV